MSITIGFMWVMGLTSIVASCVVAYSGDRTRAHQGMMEGLGFWVVAALLMIATK